MSDPLNVRIRDVEPVCVALIEYREKGLVSTYQGAIGVKFQEVEGWLRLHGIKTDGLRRIGVPFTDGEHLLSYWCCIEAPEGVMGEGPVMVRELSGGRYAVLTIPKNSSLISESINRFYSEYIPAHDITVDSSRPSLEVYHHDTMEYCIPVT